MVVRRVLLLAFLAALTVAAPAGAATLKGQVVGAPYLADSARTAVPVLFSKESARQAKLKSPLGVAVVPRRRAIAAAGAPVLPGRLRVGDRFTASAKVSRQTRSAVYPSLALKRVKVTKRAKQLSTAELEELVKQTQRDLKTLGSTVNGLATYTRNGLLALNGRVDGIVGDVASLRGELSTVKGSVASLTVALETAKQTLAANIDKVRSDLQPQISTVTDQVAGIVGQLGTCGTPGTILGRICGIEALISGLDTGQLTTLTGTVNTISTVLTDTIARLTGETLATLPATLTGTLGTALTTLGGLQGTVSGLSSNLSTVTGDLSSLTSTVGGITSQLGAIDVTNLSSTVSNLLGALGADPSGLNPSSVTNLENALTTAQGQITTLTNLLGGVNVATLQGTVSGIQTSLSSTQTLVGNVCSSLSGVSTPVYSLLLALLGNASLPVIPGC